MSTPDLLTQVFWHAIAELGLLLLYLYGVTAVADARHPDRWHKEKVSYTTQSGHESWKLVDVGTASETEKDDWVLMSKVAAWFLVVVALGSGLLYIGGQL